MESTNRVLVPSAGLVFALLTTSVFAQPPSAPPGRDKAPRQAERAAAKAEKADEKAARAEAKSERADAKANARDNADASDGGPSQGNGEHGRGPMHAGHDHERRGFRALGEDYRQGRVKKADLEGRLAAMRESMKERRHDHQRAIERRWGAALAHPACREELRHHARREAFLERALFLARTEVTKDQEKLVERIEKLMTKEDERHARAMERLKATPAGATPSALPAPGASAMKAGDQ